MQIWETIIPSQAIPSQRIKLILISVVWKEAVSTVLDSYCCSQQSADVLPFVSCSHWYFSSQENDVYITQSLLDAGMAIRSGDLPPAPPVPANAGQPALT